MQLGRSELGPDTTGNGTSAAWRHSDVLSSLGSLFE
jgi:hypothetical protein